MFKNFLEINCWSWEKFHLNDFPSKCIFKAILDSLLFSSLTFPRFGKMSLKRVPKERLETLTDFLLQNISRMLKVSKQWTVSRVRYISGLELHWTGRNRRDIHTDDNNDHGTRSGHQALAYQPVSLPPTSLIH